MSPGICQNAILQTGNSQILLTWGLVSGATSYTVQRSTDNVNFTTVASPTVPSYLDTAVTTGVNYFYQVASVNASGSSPFATPYPASITPCLPGQINLGYIRYLSQLRADKLNSEFLTTDEWNSNINQSIYELYDILVTKYGDDYFMSPQPYLFSTTGASVYPLPDGSSSFKFQDGSTCPAIYKLLGVDCGVSTGANAWVTLKRYNWIDRNRFIYPQLQANALGVFNLSYRQMGNNLYFIPNPSAGQFIQIWYVPIMTQLLQDTDMLSFSVSGWSELIIVDAALKALLKEESFEQASAMQIIKTALLTRIEETAASRDIGQPNTVSDTRLNTGGFWGDGSQDGSGTPMGGWAMLALPAGISNNIGNHLLSHSILLSQSYLGYISFGIAIAYLIYKNPSKFRSGITFTGARNFISINYNLTSFKNHVSRIIFRSSEE